MNLRSPSSSSISSSRSLSPLLSPSSHLFTTPQKTMEEVWRDISSDNAHHYSHFRTNVGDGTILQDFLARPFNKDIPPPLLSLNSGPNTRDVIINYNNNDDVRFPSYLGAKKRSSECGDENRRNKRMIKNRESASRSRARKQAYTIELEIEVAQLTQENVKLKRQQEHVGQLYMAAAAAAAAAAAQVPKKHTTLLRTSTF